MLEDDIRIAINLNPGINTSLVRKMVLNKSKTYRVYKIKRISDGMFSTVNGWSQRGKIFGLKNHAMSHVGAHKQKFIEHQSVLVTYTIEELEKEVINVRT